MIATEVISENIYTYTGSVSHAQCNSSLDYKANTSKTNHNALFDFNFIVSWSVFMISIFSYFAMITVAAINTLF